MGMTFGASGYDQCVEPVGVVSGWWIHSLPHMKHCYSSCLCSFWQPYPYFLFNFCKLCFIFVFRFLKSHKRENNRGAQV